MRKIIAATIAASMLLIGCGKSEAELLREEALTNLQFVWDETERRQQAQVCLLWLLEPDTLTEDIKDITAGYFVSKDDVKEFFDRECRS